MTPPRLGQYVVCPEGLFVQVESLIWSQSLHGGPKDWFDSIIRDFRLPQRRIEFLVLVDMATEEPNGAIQLDKRNLDLIKDYLPKFDYLFVAPVKESLIAKRCDDTKVHIDVTNVTQVDRHVSANREVAREFIQYLRDNNITIPIHWYILPEPNLIWPLEPYKKYISKYIDVMTNLSADNNLNAPEFLWSPYFSDTTLGSADDLRDLLLEFPKLGWMHVQDMVGSLAVRNSTTGKITFGRFIDQVVNYVFQFITPVVQQGILKNLRVNAEMFVFGDEVPRKAHPADPAQRSDSQRFYNEKGLPLGACYEIRHWYGSLYYRYVPNVIGMDPSSAEQAIQNRELVPSTVVPIMTPKITGQRPGGGTLVPVGSNVILERRPPLQQ